ncbi:VOC family protein [Phycicoccus sp. M110.8]|uniref:VOC family protein n=1 Tax=Phycicoccus sp. M110.8 TaxID=3075433 RepID=UPI0028FDB35E|nr:VOC family protein [Phycicoccus sp. M110.8]MDU0313806.1 VOC family protein [Phycicoccus sp. M110.8]HET8766607.1 VOC family protein [Pedococcus sp.]
MRVDHVSYAAEHDGLQATAERLSKLIGVDPVDGGIHPRFGTRNVILPLAHDRYVEVVEVLDHPASDKAPFGQAVRARSENGGGWLGWVVAVDDIKPVEERIGRQSVEGNRHRPDGVELRWRQLGVKGLISDPQLPFFVQWEDRSLHPSVGAHTEVTIEGLQIAGDPARVREWLDLPPEGTSTVIDFTFVAPHGTPGLLAVTFATPTGTVTV